jgi:hypothetical protein
MPKYIVTVATDKLCGFTETIEVVLPEEVDIEEYDWMRHPDVETVATELVFEEEQNRMIGVDIEDDASYDDKLEAAEIFEDPSYVSLESVYLVDENGELVEGIEHLYSFTCGTTIIDHSLDDLKELIMTNSGIKL